MDLKLISVIVPVYNVEKYVEQCLDSILNQSYKNIEVILINDGSTDSSGQICDLYKKKDSRIIVLHKKNSGQSDARNIGLSLAKGEYIAFVDSDDYIDLSYLLNLYNLSMEYNSDITCCSFYSSVKNIKKSKITKLESKRAISYVLQDKIVAPSPCGRLFNKYLFNNIKFTSGKIFEDFLITPVLFSTANFIVISSEQLYYYRVNVDSTMNANFSKKYLDIIDVHNSIASFLKNKYNDQKLLDLVKSRKARFCINMLTKYIFSNSNDIKSKNELLIEVRNNYKYFLFTGFFIKDKIKGLLYIIHFNLSSKVIRKVLKIV